MEDCVISIGEKIVECLAGPILRHARYLFFFNKFMQELENAKDELNRSLEEVKERKEEAARNSEELMLHVKNWLNEVEKILKDVLELQRKVEGARKSCFNLSLMYSIAKQMDNDAKQMMKLKDEYHFEKDHFSIPSQLPGITYFSSKDFVDFTSRKSTYNDLLEAIKDGKNKMIGLYGMGGSGKTTLATQAGKTVDELKLFDKVVIVVVSKSVDEVKIQQEIAEQIHLKFQEETQFVRAQRLSERLKNKKSLIIFDDVWSKLRLENIGIPLNEGCCVMLTTRLYDVCVSMDCEKIIELLLLKEEEACTLFKLRANLINVSMNEFDSIGRKIVDECKGLPIAIVTMGSTLKGRSIHVWKSTLRRLQNPPPLDIEDDLRTPYATLEVSYDNLSSPLAKSLFLLCSMFPEDHEIHKEDLIRFCKGTLKLEETIVTMEDARIEILAALEILVNSCLLMHTNEGACVKMHDLVQDVALWITKKQHQAILVDSHAVSRMLVENESLKETKVISLWNLENNFKFSNQLRCPTLEILLLHPTGFIRDLGGIEALKVLAFVTNSFHWKPWLDRIQWLVPQSIMSSLINLHTICFREIALGDISFLCQLIKLEILDLRGSQFYEVPTGIVNMEKLKLLDVFGCQIQKSPIEVIRRYEQLEELYLWDKKSVITENFSLSGLKRYAIYDSTCSFPIYRVPFEECLNACIGALRALCIQGFRVSALNSSIRDLILKEDCLWLENCRWDYKDINFEIKHLAVSHCPQKRFIVLDNLQTGQLFSHLITLRLEEMNSLEQVFQDSSIRYSLPMLQELYIKSCPKLTTISTHATITSLPKLRRLEIHDCKTVKWLLSYSLAFHCPSVKVLYIHSCFELESLIDKEATHGDQLLDDAQDYPYEGNETERAFVVVTAKCLDHLRNQKLLTFFLSLEMVSIVSSGRRMKGMFEVEGMRGTVEGKECIEAQEQPLKLNSELCRLWLQELAELKYIWKGPTQSVSLRRLEYIRLGGCPKLRNIFTLATVTCLPELREINVLECEEWEGIFCDESLKNISPSSNVCFPKLRIIHIAGSNKVKVLFSYSQLASHYPSLEELDVCGCSQLERLVDEEAPYRDGLALLKLKTLNLLRLPKLRGIFRGGLERPQRKNENDGVMVMNSQLYSILLCDLLDLEYIWKGPTQSVSLHRLVNVKLRSCPKLRNIFTLTTVISFPKLQRLNVHDCEEWEGLSCEESLKSLSPFSNVCFPQLQHIEISKCNKAKWLFSYFLASHCPSLERIRIEDCSEIEGVVLKGCEGDKVGDHEKLFPRLKDLRLKNLPKLREIYAGYEFNLQSNTIDIEDCPNIHNTPPLE